MRTSRLGLLVLVAMMASAAPPAGATLTPRQLVTIHPGGAARARGIGPVRLEMTERQVEEAVGSGRLLEHGVSFGEPYASFRYQLADISIEVAYNSGTVSGITTKSPGAILFGHRLADGVNTFRRILRHRRHWHIDTCRHRVFTALAPGGPGTGIEWKAGKLALLMIDAGGVLDDCADL